VHVKKVFESMVYTRKNDEAVSPVIGVILMVAITVILAAVIAAFVFGMSGNINKTKTVAVTVGQNGGNIMLTFQGGQDASSVSYLKITVPSNVTYPGPVFSTASVGGVTALNMATGTGLTAGATAPAGTAAPNVGAVYTLLGMGTGGQDEVVVVGHFADNTEQVILDSNV